MSLESIVRRATERANAETREQLGCVVDARQAEGGRPAAQRLRRGRTRRVHPQMVLVHDRIQSCTERHSAGSAAGGGTPHPGRGVRRRQRDPRGALHP